MIRRAMLWLNQTVRLIPARKLIGLSGPYMVLVCFVRYLRTGEDIPLNLSTVLQWYTATTATSFINKRNAARKLKGVGGPSGTKRGAPTDGEDRKSVV